MKHWHRFRSLNFSKYNTKREKERERKREKEKETERDRERQKYPEVQSSHGSFWFSSFIPIATVADPAAAAVVDAVAVAERQLCPSVLSALSPVRAFVPSPCVAARSCCVADDRCSCGSAGCSGSSKPACRCYRSVPCWAWCARSVCAASTALGRWGFCCKARIETHRTRRCRPTDLAAEPDTGVTFFWVFVLERQSFGRSRSDTRVR